MGRVVVANEGKLIEGDADVEECLCGEEQLVFNCAHGLGLIRSIRSADGLEEVEDGAWRLEGECLCFGGPEVCEDLHDLAQKGLGGRRGELVEQRLRERIDKEEVSRGVLRWSSSLRSQIAYDAVDVGAGRGEQVACFEGRLRVAVVFDVLDGGYVLLEDIIELEDLVQEGLCVRVDDEDLPSRGRLDRADRREVAWRGAEAGKDVR